MQRKALKQLNKVTQWTNEKVFSGEKTEFSEDFAEFEAEIEPLKIGVERLHATSQAFYDHLSKLKPSADPHPPAGSGKDKMRVSEALGLVMIDYGNDAGGAFGDALIQFGRARVKIAGVQDEFSLRLQEGFISNTEASLEGVNEYKAYRRKMDSRRLTLDSALARMRTSKKENPVLEQEVEIAQLRLDEAEEDTALQMQNIKKQEVEQFTALTDWLDAELEYFASCKEILGDLRASFPSSHEPSASRARAKSNASARSSGRTPTRSTYAKRPDSDEDLEVYSPTKRRDSKVEGRARSKSQSQVEVEDRPRSGSKSRPQVEGRERSNSTASAGAAKPKKGIMATIGSFGMKSANSAGKSASKAASKGKSAFGRSKYGNLSDEERERVALDSDDDPYKRSSPSPTLNRARSQSVASVVTGLGPLSPPDTRRRALTSPPSPAGRWVKVLFDYEGRETDELPLRRGQLVEVTAEVPGSTDWLIGESNGRSGMFPKAYTEEVEDKPVVPQRPSLPKARSLPPREFRKSVAPMPLGHSPSRSTLNSTLDSGSEHGEVDDGSALVSTPASPATGRSRAGSTARKPPPPPPSRRMTGGRSRSSTLSKTPMASDEDKSQGSGRSGQMSPPRFTPQVQAARSPFEHSDDDDAPLSHGLGAMHIRQGGNGRARACGVCGCADFTQNVFKANGVCATCFHTH
ncbi:hypothetical protein CcaverHIS002_0309100 [Cutaneotrichosporon cavernicola]|uniref:BAR-domain-containing protein n=1 Tax=Cutaneotrichosporon cavernicola TaxID=279322 RepID=A0AA48IFV6_9TREE|nr:uncharacterized protein CcaverHIS019_0308960 [Cutaneotrichosporon cavernicola]BEI83042.1 hypothetical protein CcaverHIS002_0309100 [Cutaneotrichosporon cavernicola]BEI90826.1 hypothetical protein CcaverHIS019_0308960 [Cutaneotrichosporon cavernicola]BEI98605.1 hypothetical protein CcaverHIS631_0309040 [Cutaneotrichosporon cavernicola]BEJ06374.1 hypothetical protein CcaverHIS641_0308960 [Cutaneotrichosporon cavernicola]